MTKKELEQLEKGIQKLEKLAVADKIPNIYSRGGGTLDEPIQDIYTIIEELNTLFLKYGGISFTPPEKNEQLLVSLRQWITLAKCRLQQLETTSEELLIHNAIDKKFYDTIKQIQKVEQIGILRHMRACFHRLDPQNQQGIINYMIRFPYWGSINPEKNDYTLLENRAKTLWEHKEDFLWLYQHLIDYRSKKVLLAILLNWMEFDFKMLAETREINFGDYFDLDVFHCYTNEVFVDLGAYIGDSALQFIDSYKKYKRVYCYEITPNIYAKLEQNTKGLPNIELRQKGAGEKQDKLYIHTNINSASANTLSQKNENGEIGVDVVAIDKDITEPITFIKMDIEGAEQSALKGCAEQIRKNHPKLAICTYHNNEDIWKIARMVHEIDSSYQFYMRHNGGNLTPTEYVLFCV